MTCKRSWEQTGTTRFVFVEGLVLDPETRQETLPPSPQEEVDAVTHWHPIGLEGCLVTAVDMAAQSGSQQEG